MYKPSPMHLYPLKNFCSPSMICCSFFIVVSYPILTENSYPENTEKRITSFLFPVARKQFFRHPPEIKKATVADTPVAFYEKEKSVFLILFYLFGPV